ncbi:MAG: hypothetical protein ABI068_06775 [Ktedonobacterales bacterium]
MNAMTTRFCPSCGAPQADPAARYCGNCGVTLPTPSGAPAAPVVTPPSPVRASGPMTGPVPAPMPAQPGSPPYPQPYTQPYASAPSAPITGNWQPTMPGAQPTPMPPPGVVYAPPIMYAPLVMAPVALPPAQATSGQAEEALAAPVALSVGAVFAALLVAVAFALPQQLLGVDVSTLANGDTGSASDVTGWLALLRYLNQSSRWLPVARLLFAFVFGYDPGASSAAALLTLQGERDLLLLLIGLAPLALVCAYWYTLAHTRLFKGGGVVALWIGVTLLCFCLLLLLTVFGGVILYGVQSALGGSNATATTPVWSLALLVLYPGFFVVLIALAVICALIGMLLAGVGAIRRRVLTTGSHSRHVPVFWALLGLGLAQLALFALLQATIMQGATTSWQQFPLGALLVVVAVTLHRTFATGRP